MMCCRPTTLRVLLPPPSPPQPWCPPLNMKQVPYDPCSWKAGLNAGIKSVIPD
ncbi:hypothetical protein DPMN_008410 [Dreissena polymorpha]|uniref:Uncharacterized protein n=1 Tax=Dreissena polymorpha TaxID=45954 RepID=A0A9D4RZM5_DREPO|nr:hypothetical protein DPMN_008410 [Dreissena polymorpha]